MLLTMAAVLGAAAICTLAASWVMWWACRRSALWSMAAGAVLALLALAGALAIAWFMTSAAYPR
jgi:hypothetical protein